MRQLKTHIVALRVFISIALLASSLALLLPTSATNLLASDSYDLDDTVGLDPSVHFVQIGITGDIETDILITELAAKEVVLLGTSTGLYIISEGDLQEYIATPGSVTDITILNDVNGDNQPDIVIALDDTRFPNIRCYDGINCDKLWHFAPKQDAFLENILWTKLETPTFDITAIADVNSDGSQDLVATSGYGLYVLSGKTGEQIWRFDAEDNLWQAAVIPDMNGDGIEELATGAQTGFLYVLDGKSGSLIWHRNISDKVAVFDDKGDKWATVDTCVWDIVPIEIGGEHRAAVSSEDGKVRLVNLNDGYYAWETAPLIEYSGSLQYTYYRGKNKLPTSPGDVNFLNLRLSIVEDISGDSVSDILASACVGQEGQQGAPTTNSGLYIINSVSGEIEWSNTELNFDSVAKVELATIDEKQVILLPQGESGPKTQIKTVAVEEDGEVIDTLEITSPQSYGSSVYWAKDAAQDSFVTVSNNNDLLCISSEGEIQWYYPRITNVAVESGEFTGDDTEDLFIWSKQRLSGSNNYGARILYVVDGATRSKAWSYEISYEDLVDIEGIANILVTPDLDGDDKQDIIGYTQPRSTDWFGEGYRVMAFSGSDGSILINQPVVTSTYYGIYERLYEARDASTLDTTVDAMLANGVRNTYYDAYEDLDDKPLLKSLVDDFVQQLLTDAGEYNPGWPTNPDDQDWFIRLDDYLYTSRQNRQINRKILSLDIINLQGKIALVIGCQGDIFIIDSKGDLLWTKSYDSWVYEDPFHHVQPNDWRWDGQWETRYLSLGDLNGDNIDDLVACSYHSISILISELDGNSLNFRNDVPQALTVFEADTNKGTDPSWVALLDDIDGDGIKEVLFPINQENKAPLVTIVSPASGDILFQNEWYDGNQTSVSLSSADFDNDGSLDRIVFSKWREGFDGPILDILSGNNSDIIWQFEGFQESWLFEKYNLMDIMPATAISDMNGDGTSDVAVAKFLHDQPGASISIYDTTQDEPLKEIIIERIDQRLKWDRRWHPAAAIKEVGDFNGDGTNELATVIMLQKSDIDEEQGGGQPGQNKEIWLMVVDIANEIAIAEFQILALQFIETGNENELAVVGANGELYFLNMINNLHITSPSAQSSPVSIAWDGVPEGAFNQIYIDDAEVARTNENEVILDVARGEHQIVVRSMDEYGRGLYTTTTLKVNKSSSIVIFASIALIISILVVISPLIWRFINSRLKESRYG